MEINNRFLLGDRVEILYTAIEEENLIGEVTAFYIDKHKKPKYRVEYFDRTGVKRVEILQESEIKEYEGA